MKKHFLVTALCMAASLSYADLRWHCHKAGNEPKHSRVVHVFFNNNAKQLPCEVRVEYDNQRYLLWHEEQISSECIKQAEQQIIDLQSRGWHCNSKPEESRNFGTN